MRQIFVWTFLALGLTGCDCGDTPANPDARFTVDAPPPPDGGFLCSVADEELCVGDVHTTCVLDGEFLRAQTEDCRAMGMICLPDLWCAVCRPDSIGCIENDVVQCESDGSGWEVIEECDEAEGFVCQD